MSDTFGHNMRAARRHRCKAPNCNRRLGPGNRSGVCISCKKTFRCPTCAQYNGGLRAYARCHECAYRLSSFGHYEGRRSVDPVEESLRNAKIAGLMVRAQASRPLFDGPRPAESPTRCRVGKMRRRIGESRGDE